MIYTIRDLSDGKCAVINDGTLEELQKVIRAAFPNDDSIPYGNGTIYRKGWDNNWTSWSSNLPTQSVKEFIKQLYMKEKEIIGYKAPYDLFGGKIKKDTIITELYNKRTDDANVKFHKDEYGIIRGNNFYILPQEIVETWEPVYKSTEEIVSMGSFDLKVTSEGIFHKSENITDFVKELYDFYTDLPSKFSKYDCIVDEITFKQTGCENSKTIGSQWINLWEKYQELKK